MPIDPKKLRTVLNAGAIKTATARLSSAGKENKAAAEFDLARRQAARTILKPNEVSGEYDAGRLLTTSLRGAVRQITQDDLRAFQENVKNLKKKFVGGIKAQGVIDLALADDTERANSQIRMAVPASYRGNLFHFITNAGPGSEVSRHHVNVEFLDFEAAVGASSNDPRRIGKSVANGRLRFDCDCGRHTFWYRYIATIGKYNYGRAETGYPKIRNPRLVGVACKHALRVMQVILKDAAVHTKIAGQVLKAREVLDSRLLKTERAKVGELREHAAVQTAKHKNSTNIRTTAQKKKTAAVRKASIEMKAIAAGKAVLTPTARKAANAAKTLLSLGAITQEQFNTIVANAK